MVQSAACAPHAVVDGQNGQVAALVHSCEAFQKSDVLTNDASQIRPLHSTLNQNHAVSATTLWMGNMLRTPLAHVPNGHLIYNRFASLPAAYFAA